jgi:leader peptidase (prepilin peptidase)/N-methyltransferase
VLLIVLTAVVGGLVGSVLAVVACRVPRGGGLGSGTGSDGERCGRLVDEVPLLHPRSWRHRAPGRAVAVRFPVLELATAGLFAAMAWLFGWSWALPAFLVLAAASVLLSVIDLQFHRLPNVVLGPFAGAALALLLVDTIAHGSWESLLRGLAGAAISFAVYLVLAVISPSSLGMGDVKLAGVLGLYLGYLGWRTLFLGALGGFVIAAVIGVVLLATRRADRRTQLPFGPSMLAAALIAVAVGAGAS